jgi:hypothetical protein
MNYSFNPFKQKVHPIDILKFHFLSAENFLPLLYGYQLVDMRCRNIEIYSENHTNPINSIHGNYTLMLKQDGTYIYHSVLKG